MAVIGMVGDHHTTYCAATMNNIMVTVWLGSQFYGSYYRLVGSAIVAAIIIVSIASTLANPTDYNLAKSLQITTTLAFFNTSSTYSWSISQQVFMQLTTLFLSVQFLLSNSSSDLLDVSNFLTVSPEKI